MNSIDQRIQAALNEEDKALLNQYRDEQDIFNEIAISFRGVRGLLVTLTWILMFIWGGLLVFCAYKLLTVASVENKILWLGGGIVSLVCVVALKLWYFIDLNRNAFMREFKRLELQISLLAEKAEKREN